MGILKLISFLAVSTLTAEPHADVQQKSSSFPVGGDVAVAFDYFRSLPDGSWNGNVGAFSSLNVAVGIPKDFGAQLGGSYGLYDWDGRGSSATGNSKAWQQQAFITVGLFRKTPQCSGFNAGLVYDVMINKKLGVFALNPIVEQLRAQLGYLIRESNEVGLWATVNTNASWKQSDEVPVKFRAISQVNAFWCHHFKNKAQTTIWAGTPYRRGLMYTSGRAGQFLCGANFSAPLTNALSLFGYGSYMRARSGPATQESRNYAANVCFGVNYAFGSCKLEARPYLPLANNSIFLVDTNLNL